MTGFEAYSPVVMIHTLILFTVGSVYKVQYDKTVQIHCNLCIQVYNLLSLPKRFDLTETSK